MQLIKNIDKSIVIIPETDSDNSFLEYICGLIEYHNNGATISPVMAYCPPPIINAIGTE
jgi:hypothetical protein